MKSEIIYFIVGFTISFLFSACSGHEVIEGSIEKVRVDHVVALREGCRFTSIYFDVLVQNNSNKDLNLRIPYLLDHCERNINKSPIKLRSTNFDNLLVGSRRDSLVTIGSNTQKVINLMGAFMVDGGDLNYILYNYNGMLNSDFIISWSNDSLDLVFRKSDAFEIELYLDDKIVNREDSVSMYRSLRPKTVYPPSSK